VRSAGVWPKCRPMRATLPIWRPNWPSSTKGPEESGVRDPPTEKALLLLSEQSVRPEEISLIQSPRPLLVLFRYSGGWIKNWHRENISLLLIGLSVPVIMRDNWTRISITLIPNFLI
jgi:hypothetical protein